MDYKRILIILLATICGAVAQNWGPSCIGRTVLRSAGASCDHRRVILNQHNRLRQLVALGQILSQPSASNMKEMLWDDELARIAQNWANQCAEDHDNYRNVHRFPVGQNIARTWTTKHPEPQDVEPDWVGIINDWFNEVKYYRSGYSKQTGHYTQIVWGDTYLVGCGYSYYYDPGRGYTKNYVCNYGPSGNVLGRFPYQRGPPACGRYGMQYSNRYSGLCSENQIHQLGYTCGFHQPLQLFRNILFGI